MAQHPAHSQNHRHPDEPPPEEIARALKGADYPMGKEKLWRWQKATARTAKSSPCSTR
jgi:hypothetical protein